MIRQSYSGYPEVFCPQPSARCPGPTPGCSRADSGRWICGTIIRGSTGTGLGSPEHPAFAYAPRSSDTAGYW